MHSGKLLLICKHMRWATYKTLKRHATKLSQWQEMNYLDMENARMNQARRSVLVHHDNQLSQLVLACQRYGRMNAVYIYKQDKTSDYALVEFESLNSARTMLAECSHFGSSQHIKMPSRLLHFVTKDVPTSKLPHNLLVHKQEPVKFNPRHLLSVNSLSKQIEILYEQLRLTELEIRLRFYLCVLIEDIVQRLMDNAIVRPFGSAISGSGKTGCDLDLAIILDNSTKKGQAGPFFFITKKMMDEDRTQSQTLLAVLGRILQGFLPKFQNVAWILKARVPIVKLYHSATDVHCDISSCNDASLAMSELLFMFGRLEVSFQPLLFAVRYWAQCHELTRSNDSSVTMFNNFMVTSLVVFFLQSRRLLPPIKDVRRIFDEDNFPKPVRPANNEVLGSLLVELFEFYADFDFSNNCLSLIHGQALAVADFQDESRGMYVDNPFEENHNMCRNVGPSEIERFQVMCREAHAALTSPSDGDSGLLSILKGISGGSQSEIVVSKILDS